MDNKVQVIGNEELREQLYRYTIDPGLELYILPKAGYQKKYAIYSTRFGSIDSRIKVKGSDEFLEVPDGMAHFLEHKLFEDEQGDVFNRFAALGATPNAFTSFTNTTYLFSTTEHFPQCLELLLDFVQKPYFTEETVQKEQGIIGQEIRMYQDHPQWRVFFNLLGALYREHPVRIDIAGTEESISRITPDLLYQCYRTFYHPSNMAVFITGDVEVERVHEQVENNLAKHSYRPMGKIERFYPDEPAKINEQRVTQELVVSEPLFNMGFKDPGIINFQGDQLMRRELAMELLLDIIFGRSEQLFNDLYQEGLIDDQFSAGYAAERSYAYTLIGGETADPDRLHERLLTGLEQFKQRGIPDEAFERHRRSKLGSFLRRWRVAVSWGVHHWW